MKKEKGNHSRDMCMKKYCCQVYRRSKRIPELFSSLQRQMNNQNVPLNWKAPKVFRIPTIVIEYMSSDTSSSDENVWDFDAEAQDEGEANAGSQQCKNACSETAYVNSRKTQNAVTIAPKQIPRQNRTIRKEQSWLAFALAWNEPRRYSYALHTLLGELGEFKWQIM